jgi:Na+/H+ antiporter NhaD/arsenite permease-like protein
VGTGLNLSPQEFETDIKTTLEDVAEVVFFLLGALTIVEIMDAHKGFDIITRAITATKKRDLLVVVGVLTFALSSVLNNLTVVIVMVSLLQKLVKDVEFRQKLGGLVVIASNAGGVWTPIGDITTTMLYIGGQLTTVPLLLNLFFPSVLCLIGSLGYEFLQMDGEAVFERPSDANADNEEVPEGQSLVFWGGLGGMVSVPLFQAATQCPPWCGMMFVLGLLGVITSILHGPENPKYSLKGALTRVEVPDALFFLGVLFAVGGLERIGLLKAFAVQLSSVVPYESIVAVLLGLASAVVDNVPLVAATQGMYDLSAHPANDSLWNLITYCAATGGSLLVIGSAAGVAFMGMEKGVSFGWYTNNMLPPALVGYFLGVGGILAQQSLGLTF